MNNNSWREDFEETCQAIWEDAVLLEALAVYISSGRRCDVFPQVFRRLTDYLSQHAMDLRHLGKRAGPGPQ